MPSVNGIRAGDAYVVINAIDKTGTILNRMSGTLMKWGNKMEAMGSKLMSRVFLSMIPAGFGLQFYKSFDDIMRRVEARSAGTAKEMNELRQQARDLGKATAYSATQVGELQDKLATMGYDRKAILQMTEPILNLARAAGEGADPTTDVQQAAESVQAALAGFGMDASHTTEVVNQLAAAANESNMTVKDLATVMAYSSTIASRYGVSLAEVLAIMGMWKNLGFDANVAGTAFRNIELEGSEAKGVAKFNDMLRELTGNVIEFKDAAGNLKDPVALLAEIGMAIKGLGTADQGNLLNTLFGKRAVVPAAALAEGGKTFDALFAKISGAKDSDLAAAVAKKMDSGVGGAWRKFVHTLQDVAITVSEILEPALMDLAAKVTSGLSSINAWAGANRNVIITIAEVIGLVTTLAAGLIAGGIALKLMAMGVTLVAGAFTGLALLIKLSGVAFIAHTAVVLTCNAVYTAFRLGVAGVNAVLAIIPALSAAATTAFIAFQAAMTAAAVTSMVLSSRLALWLADLAVVISATVAYYGYTAATYAWVAATVVSKAVLAALIGLFSIQNLQTLASTAAQWLMTASTSALSAAMFVLDAAIGGIVAILPVLLAALLALLIGPIIGAGLVGAFQAAADGAMVLVSNMSSGFDYLVAKGKSIASTLFTTFSAVNDALAIGDTTAAWEVGLLGLQIAWLQVLDVMHTAWDGFSNGILKTWYMLKGFFADMGASLMPIVKAAGLVLGANSPLIAGIMAGLGSIAGMTKETIEQAIGQYSNEADQALTGRRDEQAMRGFERRREIRKKQFELGLDGMELGARADAKAAEGKHGEGIELPAPGGPMAGAHALAADVISPTISGELKALEALESSAIETAKQAYENSQRNLDKSGEDPMKHLAHGIDKVAANTLVIAENIGVA